MGNRGARNQPYGYGDPYLNQYGTGYGYPPQSGLGAYGGPQYTYTTAPNVIQEPWAVTQWTEYYVPTIAGRRKRPVIYVAAPLPAPNPCAGFGGFGGGFPQGGFGGGLPFGGGGFGGGGFGGGGFGGGGFGGGLPFGGGFGGGNLGYQALPMMTVAYGGGIPGVGGGFGGLGGGLGGLGGLGGGLGGLGGLGGGGGLGGLGGLSGLGGGGLGGLGGLGNGGLGGLGGLGGGGLPLF